MATDNLPMSPAELPVWRYIADHQPVTVRQVAAHMADTTGHARTTVLTIMERLRKKGHLTRRKVQGVHHYATSVPKKTVLQGLVRDFVEQALGGSLAPFVAYLTDTQPRSDAELHALKAVVEELLTRQEEAP